MHKGQKTCLPSWTDIDDFAQAIEAAFEGKAMVLSRMRLSTTFHNKEGEVIGDRGGQCLSLRFLTISLKLLQTGRL